MSRLRLHLENHLIGRIGWLRAAVLGANDGIISNRKLDHWRCRGGRDAARCQ
jgi:vacuolar iron transporter family protein